MKWPSPHNQTLQSFQLFSIVKKTWIDHLGVLLIGLLLCMNWQGNLQQIFSLDPTTLLYALSLTLTTAVLIMALTYVFNLQFETFRPHRKNLANSLGPLNLPSCLYLAGFSALIEEILFRGALQPSLGILLTSILASFFHLSQGGVFNSWSFYAMACHTLFGMIFHYTGSLYYSILLNCSVSALFLLSQNYSLYKTIKLCLKQKAADQKSESKQKPT